MQRTPKCSIEMRNRSSRRIRGESNALAEGEKSLASKMKTVTLMYDILDRGNPCKLPNFKGDTRYIPSHNLLFKGGGFINYIKYIYYILVSIFIRGRLPRRLYKKNIHNTLDLSDAFEDVDCSTFSGQKKVLDETISYAKERHTSDEDPEEKEFFYRLKEVLLDESSDTLHILAGKLGEDIAKDSTTPDQVLADLNRVGTITFTDKKTGESKNCADIKDESVPIEQYAIIIKGNIEQALKGSTDVQDDLVNRVLARFAQTNYTFLTSLFFHVFSTYDENRVYFANGNDYRGSDIIKVNDGEYHVNVVQRYTIKSPDREGFLQYVDVETKHIVYADPQKKSTMSMTIRQSSGEN